MSASEVESNVADRKKAEQLIAFVRDESSHLGLHGFQIFWRAMAEDVKRWIEMKPEVKPPPPFDLPVPPHKSEVEEALDQVQRINDLADIVEADEGRRFAESASDTARGIGETIENSGKVTDAQKRALDNIENGISNWVQY